MEEGFVFIDSLRRSLLSYSSAPSFQPGSHSLSIRRRYPTDHRSQPSPKNRRAAPTLTVALGTQLTMLLLQLLLTHHHRLPPTVLTSLIRTAPFPLNRPRLAALMARVVAGDVAVLDETSTDVAAGEMDDFELWVCVRSQLVGEGGIGDVLDTWRR